MHRRNTTNAGLTRRQFLAYQSAVAGGLALELLLPRTSLPAGIGVSPAEDPAAHPGETAFPLKGGESRRYLVDARGKPFFVLGDTPWFLQKLKLEDVRFVLDDRRRKGFNTLFLEILDDSAMPSRDAYGNVAFEPQTDITRPVEAYWRYADTVMEEATRRGFFVIMTDLWYGAGGGLWMHHVKPDIAAVYGHFLGKRYGRFKNLMWMHCGDRNPDENLAASAGALAEAIRQEAPHHLHTAHNAHEFASSAFFHEEPWLDVNMAYTYGASYLHVLPEYQRSAPIRPVILGETGYEGEPNAIELLPDAKKGDLWNPYRIRRNAWWAVLSGAVGYCAGTRLWRWESNWRDVLQVRSVREAPHILRLMETIPWWRLVPDVKHEFVTSGFGTWKQADYVTAALADNGGAGVVYLPSPRRISVDLAKFSGPVSARWFDPTNAAFSAVEDSPFPAQGRRDFSPPDKNAAGEGDWVLLLESVGERAQGDAGTTLACEGTRFTLNGKPAFLLGISYYAGLGASEDFIRRDLDDVRRHGFNWLRVWATWNAFDNDVSAVDAQGRPREPFLGKLKGLVAECDRRGLVVDVTLTRNKSGILPDYKAHLRAVETLVEALKPHRNWYLDLANERDVRDDRYVSAGELKRLRDRVRQLDPQRLVTASFGGHDLTAEDVRESLLTIGVDFLCPHRPRDPESPAQTETKTRECLDLMKDAGRAAPLHHQEPFRRGYQGWEPTAADFLTDLRGAVAGGAAGWCFHNGTQRNAPDQQPRRSFDLRGRRLFDQLDAEERKVVAEAATVTRPDMEKEATK